ncbi:MAG: AraC family transcriptional regulator, partial [Clostridia bacterium]
IAIGVTEYLMKPIIPDEFLHTMEGVLHAIEKQRMQRREAQMTKRHYLYLAFNQLLDTQERDVLLADCRYLLMLEFDDAFFSSVGEDFEDQLPSLLPLPCDFLCLYPERAVLVFRAESQPTEEGMRLAEQSLRLHIETTYARACFAAYEPINGAADFYAAYQRMEKRADDRLMALSASDGAKLRDTYGNIPVDQMIETLVKGDMESFFEIFDAFEHTVDKHVEFSELYIKFNLSRILIALTQHGAEGANDRSIVERVFMDRDIQQNFEVVRRMAESLAEKRQIAGDPQIEEIKRYLCEHYGADVSLNHIAEIFHFSPNYLCHRFKRATGQNFIQFVNDYRMKMARELLATTDMKVSVIAQTVGFKSASYFCQRYRDCYGTSPESDRQSKPFHLLPEAP